jgi:hypothetical protein
VVVTGAYSLQKSLRTVRYVLPMLLSLEFGTLYRSSE